MRASIRDLYGETRPAELVDVDVANVTGVAVPGLGTLLFAVVDGLPRALLAQGPGRGEHPRAVLEVEGRFEVELLPNQSGEDRIVVVLEADEPPRLPLGEFAHEYVQTVVLPELEP